jgi:hypothetical protein
MTTLVGKGDVENDAVCGKVDLLYHETLNAVRDRPGYILRSFTCIHILYLPRLRASEGRNSLIFPHRHNYDDLAATPRQ